MNNINNSLTRSIFSILLGLVLVIWPDVARNYIVIIVGILFLIPGILSLVGYFSGKRDDVDVPRYVPIEGIGSLVLGLCLILLPSVFVAILMYVLGFLLILAGVQQFVTLNAARKAGPVPFLFYVFPSLILLAGLLVLFNPFRLSAGLIILCGAAAIFYGVTEMVNYFRFKH